MTDVEKKSDLLIGVMNLIEAEMHSHFSYFSANDDDWIDVKDFIRKLRSKYQSEVERDEDSQLHCWNKHILSASFRLMETGDKELTEGDKEKAKEYYEDSYRLLNAFYYMNWMKGGKKWSSENRSSPSKKLEKTKSAKSE